MWDCPLHLLVVGGWGGSREQSAPARVPVPVFSEGNHGHGRGGSPSPGAHLTEHPIKSFAQTPPHN